MTEKRVHTKDSFNLLSFALLDECVKYNDMFSLLHREFVVRRMEKRVAAYPRKTKEVSIAVGTTFRAIDFVEVLQREFKLASKSLDSFTQVALRKWGQLIEQRLNDSWIEYSNQYLEGKAVSGLVGAGKRQRKHTRKPSAKAQNVHQPN